MYFTISRFDKPLQIRIQLLLLGVPERRHSLRLLKVKLLQSREMALLELREQGRVSATRIVLTERKRMVLVMPAGSVQLGLVSIVVI